MKSHAVSVIEAVLKAVSASSAAPGAYASSALDIAEDESLPLFHIKDKRHTYQMKEGDLLPLEILFFRQSVLQIHTWMESLIAYFQDATNARTFEIVEFGLLQERSFALLVQEIPPFPAKGEICLDFLFPLFLKPKEGKLRTYLTKDAFIQSFEKRFFRLFGKTFPFESSVDQFNILPYYWYYTEIRHSSDSQPGKTQLINGCAGKLYIKGSFRDLFPYLILGSEVHAGSKLSNSQGYYHILKESPAHFQPAFPSKKGLVPVIRDVLERYDQAMESLSKEAMYPFDEDRFAEITAAELAGDTYTPAPNISFLIESPGKSDRLVEQLHIRDLIVAQYLLKTVSPVFDCFFEEESIGYRKGISRQRAAEMIADALEAGCEYVIESDIEDFFPSVDHTRLLKLIDDYLPVRDTLLRSLFKKLVSVGYVLNGRYIERIKGLPQGNPLSPILANLFLDSFDESIKALGVRLIRYADDFVILCKTREEAESLLSRTESFLSDMGLKLKKDHTAVKPIREGFEFLGMAFDTQQGLIEPEEDLRLLKKPLYVTEPFVFLSLNGDAVDIKKGNMILQTIPLRRISEIMVLDKTLFSTALIKRCLDFKIPFSIALNTGYFVTTIKPDSKKYYLLASDHAAKFARLSDTERLCIAKAVAVAKIENYISLFRQKYQPGAYVLLDELTGFSAQAEQAADIDELREIEGWTARKIYAALNGLIDDPEFHLRARERKKPDRINSLLNFGYYLLFSRINASVRALGLNPYLGFLHSPNDDYESLVSDLVDVFRARIDRFLIRLVNLKIIASADFTESEKGFYLTREGVKKFLSHWEAEIQKNPLQTDLSLKEHLYTQVFHIKTWVEKNATLSFFRWTI